LLTIVIVIVLLIIVIVIELLIRVIVDVGDYIFNTLHWLLVIYLGWLLKLFILLLLS